jgi:hypothetical protein
MAKDAVMRRAAAAFILVLAAAMPAAAQMDWLGPHLEMQRWNRLREHQQRGIERRRAERAAVVEAAHQQSSASPGRARSQARWQPFGID